MNSIHLTGDELRGVAEIQRLLLDPLAFPDLPSWARACSERWRELIGADVAILAAPSEAGLRASITDSALWSALEEYEREFRQRDPGLTDRLPDLDDASVCHESDVFQRAELLRDEAYVDWRTPNKLFDALLMTVESDQVTPAALIAYRGSDADGYRLDRKAGMARLVFPAFRHAIRYWYRGDRWASRVETFVEESGTACYLFDAQGHLVHVNDRARAMLPLGLAASEVEDAARTLGLRVMRRNTVLEGVTTRVGSIQLSALFVGRDDLAGGAPRDAGALAAAASSRAARGYAIVTVEDLSRALPSARFVERRFGLTRRQAQVAVLMARRWTCKEIARELGIRPNTARRHSAMVLRQMGLHSRNEVAGVMRAAAAEPGSDG